MRSLQVTDPKFSLKIFGKEEQAHEIADFYDEKITTIQDTKKKSNREKPAVYIECG
jgi:ABC-type Fe3+-hydroxamate transport system substrate-binding protein